MITLLKQYPINLNNNSNVLYMLISKIKKSYSKRTAYMHIMHLTLMNYSTHALFSVDDIGLSNI